MKKKKIAKIMKKEPSGFSSGAFSACLLFSPFGCGSDVWVWCESMSGAVHVWPSAAFLKLQVIQFGDDSPGLGCSQDGPSCSAKLVFISSGSSGCVSKCPMSLQDLLLPVSAQWPAVNLRLVTDPAISERASGGKQGGCDSWISHGRCFSDFREDGGCVPPPPSH